MSRRVLFSACKHLAPRCCCVLAVTSNVASLQAVTIVRLPSCGERVPHDAHKAYLQGRTMPQPGVFDHQAGGMPRGWAHQGVEAHMPAIVAHCDKAGRKLCQGVAQGPDNILQEPCFTVCCKIHSKG